MQLKKKVQLEIFFWSWRGTIRSYFLLAGSSWTWCAVGCADTLWCIVFAPRWSEWGRLPVGSCLHWLHPTVYMREVENLKTCSNYRRSLVKRHTIRRSFLFIHSLSDTIRMIHHQVLHCQYLLRSHFSTSHVASFLCKQSSSWDEASSFLAAAKFAGIWGRWGCACNGRYDSRSLSN